MGCLKSSKSRDVERNNYKKRNMDIKNQAKNKHLRRDDESSEHSDADGLSPEVSQTN